MVNRARQRGFTYLGLLFAIALLGIGLVAASEVWVATANRQRLEQLDWVGAQFVSAIGSYYESSPGALKVYPPTLQDLLEDRRYLTTRRHLRQLYPNAFSGRPDWELVSTPDGRVKGVRAVLPADLPVAQREYVFVPEAPAR